MKYFNFTIVVLFNFFFFNGLAVKVSKAVEEYHEKCLKELRPFEICDFDNDDFDYKICDSFHEVKCPEFYKSPFEFAPS